MLVAMMGDGLKAALEAIFQVFGDAEGRIDTIDKEGAEKKTFEYIDDKRVLQGVCRWRQRPKQHAARRY